MSKKSRPAPQDAVRATDNHFPPNEALYRRITPTGLRPDGRVELDQIAMPDMSVNRSKLSAARDAIRNKMFTGWGVASFLVSDIPNAIVHPTDKTRYTFGPRHRPEPDNLAHSEIWAYVNDAHVNLAQYTEPEIDMRFRRRLQLRMRIAIGPNPKRATKTK